MSTSTFEELGQLLQPHTPQLEAEGEALTLLLRALGTHGHPHALKALTRTWAWCHQVLYRRHSH